MGLYQESYLVVYCESGNNNEHWDLIPCFIRKHLYGMCTELIEEMEIY